jgi:hypothetical protein
LIGARGRRVGSGGIKPLRIGVARRCCTGGRGDHEERDDYDLLDRIRWEPRWALLITDRRAVVSLSSHTSADPSEPATRQKARQPRLTAGTSRAGPPRPQTLRITRRVVVDTQSGTSGGPRRHQFLAVLDTASPPSACAGAFRASKRESAVARGLKSSEIASQGTVDLAPPRSRTDRRIWRSAWRRIARGVVRVRHHPAIDGMWVDHRHCAIGPGPASTDSSKVHSLTA